MREKETFKALRLRTVIVVWIILCVAFIMSPASLLAQKSYPDREIELVISYPPGGVVDTGSRAFADGLSKVLKVPVIPNNKGGASGTVGQAYAAKGKKDGYTLLATLFSGMEIAPIVMGIEGDLPYVAARDFIPITMISDTPSILVVKADSPFKTVEDFVEYAKKNPGKLSWASAGVGSESHLNGEIFQDVAKIKLKPVPFKSSGEQLAVLMGGHVDFMLSTPPSMLPLIKAGNLRALAVTDDSRLASLPEVPTFLEKGYSAKWLNVWVGLYAPTGVQKNVIEILAEASEKVVKSNEFIERLARSGSNAKYFTQAEIKKYYEKDAETTRSLLKELGISPKK